MGEVVLLSSVKCKCKYYIIVQGTKDGTTERNIVVVKGFHTHQKPGRALDQKFVLKTMLEEK